MCKSLKYIGLISIVLGCSRVFSQDTLLIPEVVISASPNIPPTSAYVHLIDSGLLKSYSGRTLSDVLAQQSSVVVKDYGPGGISSLNIRGTGSSNTQVFWEGFSMNNQMLGESDLKLFPSMLADQVEIHYGNSSMVDGTGGIGGNISMTGKEHFGEKSTVELAGRLSSIEERVALFNFLQSKKRWFMGMKSRIENSENSFSYRDYTNSDLQTTVDDNSTESYHINAFGGYNLSDKSQIHLKTLHLSRDQQLSPIIGVSPKGESQKDDVANYLLKYKYNSGKIKLDLSTVYMFNGIEYKNDSIQLIANHHIESWRTLMGMHYQLYPGLQLRSSVSTELTDAQSDSYTGTKQRTHHTGQIRLIWHISSRLKTDALFRAEWIDDDTYLLPMISMDYQLMKRLPLVLYGSAGRNIRYPTLNELYWDLSGNEDLLPQDATTFEIGLRKQKQGEEIVQASFNTFHTLIENWILWLPSGSIWTPENLKKVRSYGFEGSTKIQVNKNNWGQQWWANYGYTRSETTDNYDGDDETIGKQLIYTPEHKLTMNWKLSALDNFILFRVNYSSRLYINPENTSYIPHSSPVDIAIGKNWNNDTSFPMSVQFTCHNLFDEEIQYVAHRTLPGRYFSINFSIGYEK